jgi:(p)ppGpp synthase/HD superfamily hydrolase
VEIEMNMESPWSQDKYIDALKFAAEAHKRQKVPGSNLPYLVHVCLVAMEIIAALEAESGCDGDLAVQSALLHDVIEDTPKTYDDILDIFGKEVAEGVRALTKKDSLPTKSQQMADSLSRIKAQPREIWMVKLADRITNMQPPPGHWGRKKRSKDHREAIRIRDSLSAASPFLARRLGVKIDAYAAYLS